MRKSFLTILILASLTCQGQSIQSYLNYGKTTDFRSIKLVLESTTQITFYNANNIEKKKEITSYNDHNNSVVELRYNEDTTLKQRLIRTYDSTGVRCLVTTFENWHPILGHRVETTFNEYDAKGTLNTITKKGPRNNIIRQTKIINNEKGNPIELTMYFENQIQGKEIASYNYEKNEVTISYFNSHNEIINTQTVTIESNKSQEGDIVNENGDIIKSKNYQKEIKYDKYGNWIKEVYSVIKNGKKIKKSESTRSIKYRK